jgi:hypothetical protein
MDKLKHDCGAVVADGVAGKVKIVEVHALDLTRRSSAAATGDAGENLLKYFSHQKT